MDGGWGTGAGLYRVRNKAKKQARRQKNQVKEKEIRKSKGQKVVTGTRNRIGKM